MREKKKQESYASASNIRFTFLAHCQIGVILMTAQSGFYLSVETLKTLHELHNRIGLKDLRHFFIQSKVTQTNRDSFAHVFPRVSSATCNSSFDWCNLCPF